MQHGESPRRRRCPRSSSRSTGSSSSARSPRSRPSRWTASGRSSTSSRRIPSSSPTGPSCCEPLADRLGETLVLSTAQALTPEAVAETIAAWGRPVDHIRVVADLGASAPAPACLWEEPESLVALHDLAFLTLQVAFDRLAEEGTSLLGLFLDAVPDGVLHPLGGLFSGLLKSCALELPKCLVHGVFTSERDVAAGVRQAEAETTANHFLPLTVYDGGVRKTTFVEAIAGDLPADAAPRIDASSVVLAVGGARGITAELMKSVAEHFRPRLYLLGDDAPRRIPARGVRGLATRSSPAGAPTTSAPSARRTRTRIPGSSTASSTAWSLRATRAANLDEMSRHCGADRVTYVAADVTDGDALAAAIDGILAAEGKIDLVVNAPGINRAASIPQKSFADFRAVRDLKLRAYQNLKRALRESPPRMWCNFGSFIGFTGQLGETDYASANDMLATGAAYAAARSAATSSRSAGRCGATSAWAPTRS